MLAVGASAPVDDLGLIDLKTVIILGNEARRRADSTIDIEDLAAITTHQMMVIVANPIFVASRRTNRLNSPDETIVGESTESVVDRLAGDRADLVSHDLGQFFGRSVRPTGDGLHDGQALGRDLQPTAPQLAF